MEGLQQAHTHTEQTLASHQLMCWAAGWEPLPPCLCAHRYTGPDFQEGVSLTYMDEVWRAGLGDWQAGRLQHVFVQVYSCPYVPFVSYMSPPRPRC